MVEIIKAASPIELGDTGKLDVIANTRGDVQFTVSEHGLPRASLILTKDRVHSLIKALCQMTGVQVRGNV